MFCLPKNVLIIYKSHTFKKTAKNTTLERPTFFSPSVNMHFQNLQRTSFVLYLFSILAEYKIGADQTAHEDSSGALSHPEKQNSSQISMYSPVRGNWNTLDPSHLEIQRLHFYHLGMTLMVHDTFLKLKCYEAGVQTSH